MNTDVSPLLSFGDLRLFFIIMHGTPCRGGTRGPTSFLGSSTVPVVCWLWTEAEPGCPGVAPAYGFALRDLGEPLARLGVRVLACKMEILSAAAKQLWENQKVGSWKALGALPRALNMTIMIQFNTATAIYFGLVSSLLQKVRQ